MTDRELLPTKHTTGNLYVTVPCSVTSLYNYGTLVYFSASYLHVLDSASAIVRTFNFVDQISTDGKKQ